MIIVYYIILYLPTSMHKSPRIVPGAESLGLVAPNITLPVLTTSLPSQTLKKISLYISTENNISIIEN